ncbi:hypothetical protein F5887DRAFT_972854 [Amanita rubescens]|nr:hypothetical protein F5887DRAFT_972854 [Amanita rubescens]
MASPELTPTRRLPFPMASQPSPAHPQRSSPALPQLPPSSSSSHPLSADALLKTHSAAHDPKLAALEQAISERNNLSAQNSQLWKLIEKQRAGYNHILKELDRIRGERDTYKAKLGISNSSSKRDRSHKLSVTHQSDDHHSPDTSVVPSRKTSSASLSGQPRLDFGLQNPVAKSKPVNDSSTSLSLVGTSNSTYDLRRPTTDGINTPSSASSNASLDAALSAYNQANGSGPRSAHHTPQGSSASTITLLSQNYSSLEAKSPKSKSTPNLPDAPTLKSLSPPTLDRQISRESRISLPDEARHYIANMIPSPVQSSRGESFAASPRQKDNSTSGASNSPILGNESRQREFLDMYGEDEETGGDVDEDLASINSEQAELSFSADTRLTDSPHPSQQTSISDASSLMSQGAYQSDRGRGITHAAVDDFPLPPSNIHPYPQRSAISQGAAGDQSHAFQPHKQQDLTHSSVTQSQSSSSRQKPSSPSHPQADQAQIMSPLTKASHFRALPLLPGDLPTTTINVSHSFVRPNDRGKEVLSFVVHVNPGNGKQVWKIEKMYSDVLNLDQRVRQSVGKGVGKKIANLPEGKLWKDHAPAKVDQRKAVLEHYLQTLINLPVKNNNEVIAFFTTDIVRETKQPVMQAGHKEGYLTKRGKNFGGWKTRYFVLQGPVLEYYDCRGGTHLGSIVITGAQIGRQQRTERTGADDDNEYRHAFLIVEAKKGAGGHHPRHVLCAESDEERDSWVDMLVRYFTGTYSEDSLSNNVMFSTASGQAPPRASSGSADNSTGIVNRTRGPLRNVSRDEIAISKGLAIPIFQLAPDANNPKFFQASPMTQEAGRPSSPYSLSEQESQSHSRNETQSIGTFSTSEPSAGLPSSLPEQSILSVASATPSALDGIGNYATPRANSELGHYADLRPSGGIADLMNPRRLEKIPASAHDRKIFHPAPPTPHADRVPSPDKLDSSSRVKISGPMNGAPIPSGFKFGGHGETAITSNDRREKAKSRSFWGFGKANGDKQTVTAPPAVFGVPLDESLEVAQICNLPAIVFRAIQYLEAKKADQEEGIYRLSGSSAVIKSLKDRFNLEGDVNLLASDEYWDPHAIAGLLKSFLRELPASILTRELHLRFLAVIDFVDPQERIRELSQLIAALPLPNYTLLRALTAHLILIVQNSAVNKMTMRNVGIVFSPTLGIPAGVFSLMLGEFNRVFNVDAIDEETGTEGSDESSSDHDLYRRNSQRYSEAAADQLLGLSGRSLKAAANDDASDGEDMVQDGESEIADGDITAESFPSNISTPSYDQVNHMSPPETPTAPKISKASHAAAARGLNITITPSDRGNRHSHMMGLPASPRPPHSPIQGPNDSAKASSS